MWAVYVYLLVAVAAGLLLKGRQEEHGSAIFAWMRTLAWGGGAFTLALGTYAYEAGLKAIWPALALVAGGWLGNRYFKNEFRAGGAVSRLGLAVVGLVLVAAGARTVEVALFRMDEAAWERVLAGAVLPALLYFAGALFRWGPMAVVQATAMLLALVAAPVLLVAGQGLAPLMESLQTHSPALLDPVPDMVTAGMALLVLVGVSLVPMLRTVGDAESVAPRGWRLLLLALMYAGAIAAGLFLRARIELPSSEGALFGAAMIVSPSYLAGFTIAGLMLLGAYTAVWGLGMVRRAAPSHGTLWILVASAAGAVLPVPFGVASLQYLLAAVALSLIVLAMAPSAVRE